MSDNQDEPSESAILVRLPAELHRAVKHKARQRGISMNRFILGLLEDAVMEDRSQRSGVRGQGEE